MEGQEREALVRQEYQETLEGQECTSGSRSRDKSRRGRVVENRSSRDCG